MSNDRLIHTGVCDDCMTAFAAWPHPERETEVPEPSQWESFATECPVCEGHVSWDWTDPMSEHLNERHWR